MLRVLRLLRVGQILLYALFLAMLLGGSTLLTRDETDRLRRFTRPYEFDYFDWTLNAIGIKLSQAAMDSPDYLNQPARHQIMVDYLHLIDSILKDEDHLNLIYADPSVYDPVAASASVRAELSTLYARQRQLDPLAESVLQDQVSAVVANLGLTTGGQPIPPVLFHISPLPYNLIISPRYKIQQDASISLVPDLTVDRQANIENDVDVAFNVSSLVVPVGGIGSYPTMVMRTTALDWLADTVSHEWIHNWLTLRPLGLNYETSPELRTMNETTASIAGHEIATALLKSYYPELVAGLTEATVSLPAGPIEPGSLPRPPFDFRAEMHTTRVHADDLLAQGKIAEAETYMEQRRELFWDNGYPLRKLNQAYFAFYGAYADIPGGAAGADPVGPAVRLLRERSRSLADFMKTIAGMSSFKELQTALAR